MRLRAALPTHSCNSLTFVQLWAVPTRALLVGEFAIKIERIEDKKDFIYPSVKVMKIKYIGLDSINRSINLYQNAGKCGV